MSQNKTAASKSEQKIISIISDHMTYLRNNREVVRIPP